jgi:hypothetical protein
MDSCSATKTLKQPSLLARTLPEPAKTSHHLLVPYGRRLPFGQNHAFGGFHLGDFGVFREMESTDHKMKHGETLCVVWLCGRLLPFAGTRKEGTVHKAPRELEHFTDPEGKGQSTA